MRSRFLNTDYFFTASKLTETLKNFKLFSLPPPISPPNPPLDIEFPIFDLDSPIDLEIDHLHFDDALSDLFSGVIPQSLAIEGEIDASESAGKCLDHRSDAFETRISEGSQLKEIQFELLEVDFPLRKSMSSCEVEEAGLCLEVPCTKIHLDNIDIEMEVTITYPLAAAKSILMVEDLPDCYSGEINSSSPDNISKDTVQVPHFEVREIGLGFDGRLSTEEVFNSVVPTVGLQHSTHGEELVVNAKEFIGSTDIDIMEDLSEYAASEECLKDESISFNSVLDMNVINLNGTMLLEENAVFYPVTSNVDCSPRLQSLCFQEVQILDVPSVHIFEVLSSSEAAEKPDISEQMFKDDFNSVGRFYELVISSELALVDDTFKSLPVPIFCNDKDMKSRDMIFGDVLRVLKPHTTTACDGLYLDWHPLLEEICSRESCSTYMCMLQEVNSYNIDSELGVNGEDTLNIDTTFLDDSLEMPNMLQCQEVLTEVQRGAPSVNDPSAKPTSTRLLKDDTNRTVNGNKMQKTNAEKASSLFASMSQTNDLNFFLDACRGTSRKSCEEGTTNRYRGEVTPPGSLEQPSDLPKVDFETCRIKVHQVSLSDHILDLIDHIQKSYLAILKYGTNLRSGSLFATKDDFEFLSLPKRKLLKLITDKGESQFSSGGRDETFVGLLTLYALKQLAYLLCFYGVHSAHLYISNLIRNMEILVVRLRPLESLIKDACQKAEKHITESHPSISLIDGILKSNSHQNGKILIITERFLWLPLKQRLACMNIKFHEVRHPYKISNQLDTVEKSGFGNHILEALEHSDCLLISHENVSALLPFNKFCIIFEYGGPCVSPRITSFSSKLSSCLQVHFLKVSMGNHSLTEKFYEGFDVSHLDMEGVSRTKFSLQGNLNSEQIVQLLEFVPIEKAMCFSSGSENHVDVSNDESSMRILQSLSSKNTSSDMPSSPDVVIVVNTQNFEKKMLISRRSSYQKVLALEKGGIQVVEREINLPLDLIFSAAVCLVWYETQNIGDNITATTSIPMFMEMIATNILMSLSFAFSGCILIFEGESSFLSAIMESSDALYAAAASLDLNLQLFCSYMPDSTDEIILSCIRNATTLYRGLYPVMPESETLGESFLTAFPSINPLSAHAILSTGGMLIEFLEWSQECRIQAIGKYHIPDESIKLFDVLCRFGEVGESKSVMTECSSIGSDISSGKLQSEKKRKKSVMNSHNIDMPMDGTFYFRSLDQKGYSTSEVPKSSNARAAFNIPDMKRTKSHEIFIDDDFFVDEREFGTSMLSSSLDSGGTVGCDHLGENLTKKSTDYVSAFLDENYPSNQSPLNFLGKQEPRKEATVRSSLLSDRRMAFNLPGHRKFPKSSDINWNRDGRTSIHTGNQSLISNIFRQKSSRSNKDDSPTKHAREYSDGTFNQKGSRHVFGLSNQAKEFQLHGRSTHSKVSQSSSRPYRGPPHQTSEFLHKTNGKKKELHQQTLECNTCLSCPGSSKKSNTILDSFRYQGGRQTSDIVKNQWRNKGKVTMNVRNEAKKDSSLNIPQTWTPIDKRARQNLSFTRTGDEKQSKLVWRNRCSPSSGFNPRKRWREEA